jgi:lipoprotein Spr/probable lipoprotein NlpC
MLRYLLVSFVLLVLSGCSTTAPEPKPLPIKKHTLLTPTHTEQKDMPLRAKLYAAYEKYAGVKYCYGGTNKSGIDCSALVQNIYKEAFGIHIPRTTKEQIKIGKKVSKKELREGDILFFRTSYKTLHSAIYLQKGEFIHASSKHGVSLSSIHNPYWRNKYLQARRIFF